MGEGFRRLRRATSASVMALTLVGLGAACSSVERSSPDAETGTVAIGAGEDPRTPAVRRAARGGTEPTWAATMAPPATPAADAADRLAVADLRGAVGLTAPPRAPGLSAARSGADYAGTMHVEIAYYDYCQTGDGNLGFAGSRTYDLDAEVFVNPPAAESGIEERSPFNLIVGTENGVEGAISAVSATVVTDPRDGRSTLLDYWDIDEDGDGVEGVLTDRWPGYVLNTISTAQLIVPCQTGLVFVMPDSIAEGARLAGSVTEDRVRLQLVGQSFDREVRFRATVTTRRRD